MHTKAARYEKEREDELRQARNSFEEELQRVRDECEEECEALREQNELLESSNTRLAETILDVRAENAELRDVRAENAQLRSRVQQLLWSQAVPRE